MDFISAEEFLKQDEKVRQMFLGWWKPSVGDLYKWISNSTFEDVQVLNKSAIDTFKYDEFINFKKDCIPLLTEGQLRKFIENKYLELNMSKVNIELEYYSQRFIDNNHTSQKEQGYYIQILDSESECACIDGFNDLGNDLLQAYWKVALEIAKQEYK